MPNDYFVRITHSYERCASMISRWALECDKILVYEHVGGKTEKVHIHAIVRGSRVCSKQLRNIGIKFVDLKGNGNCSFKACKTDEDDVTVTYMTKGNLEPKYNKGYEPAWIDMRKSEWREKTAKVSPLMMLYCAFENENRHDLLNLQNQTKQLPPDMDGRKILFNGLKRTAYKWLFDKYQLISGRFISEYKTIVMTYSYKYNISIPDDCRWSEWL